MESPSDKATWRETRAAARRMARGDRNPTRSRSCRNGATAFSAAVRLKPALAFVYPRGRARCRVERRREGEMAIGRFVPRSSFSRGRSVLRRRGLVAVLSDRRRQARLHQGSPLVRREVQRVQGSPAHSTPQRPESGPPSRLLPRGVNHHLAVNHEHRLLSQHCLYETVDCQAASVTAEDGLTISQDGDPVT